MSKPNNPASLTPEQQAKFEEMNEEAFPEESSTNDIKTLAYARSKQGNEVWLDCTSGHTIKVKYPDKEVAWSAYCKYYRVTIERITEDQVREDIESSKH